MIDKNKNTTAPLENFFLGVRLYAKDIGDTINGEADKLERAFHRVKKNRHTVHRSQQNFQDEERVLRAQFESEQLRVATQESHYVKLRDDALREELARGVPEFRAPPPTEAVAADTAKQPIDDVLDRLRRARATNKRANGIAKLRAAVAA